MKKPAARKPAQGFDVLTFRSHLGLLQSDLAKRLGVTEKTINKWERHGARPRQWCVNRMKEIAAYATVHGVLPPRAPKAPPCVRRRIPEQTVKTGNPALINVAPSSFE